MGDGGWGIGDWGLGLGIGPNPQSPIPNPQSPIPNPQLFNYLLYYFYLSNKINIKNNNKYIRFKTILLSIYINQKFNTTYIKNNTH